MNEHQSGNLWMKRNQIQCMLWFWLLLAASRFAAIFALGQFLNGQHFTDDYRGVLAMVDSPMQILLARSEGGFAFWPPFFPVLVFLIGKPAGVVLSDFYLIRTISVAFELLAWPLVWLCVMRAFAMSTRQVSAFAFAYILAPVAWMSTSVMGQDESVALLFIAGATLLAMNKRWTLAALACGLGAVSAKVYLAIPLAAFVLLPWDSWLGMVKRAAIGLLPIVLVYGFVAVMQLLRVPVETDGTGVAILDFTPIGVHAVSGWVMVYKVFDVSMEHVKYISAAVAFLAAMSVAAWSVMRRDIGVLPPRVLATVTAMLLSVFLVFYHCDPEYYLMVAPFVIAATSGWLRWIVCVGMLSLGYVVNIAYGVSYAKSHGASKAGKSVFVDIYDRLVPIEPDVVHTLALVGLLAANLILLGVLLRRLWSGRFESEETSRDQGDSTPKIGQESPNRGRV
ncbi:MAG: hypothetical protein AAGB29_06075 [Planctomycetota bacterium]